MKIKQIVLGCSIAIMSTASMALTSSPSTLVNYTTDEHGILFSTSFRGFSTCRQDWGNEYRISIDHPNYKALASTFLAISLDAKNSPFTFSYNFSGGTRCPSVTGIHHYIGT